MKQLLNKQNKKLKGNRFFKTKIDKNDTSFKGFCLFWKTQITMLKPLHLNYREKNCTLRHNFK